MCKTGRKINKINFNKFIWFYWKMKKKKNIYIYIYIYIYIFFFFILFFFGWFSISWNEKKTSEKNNILSVSHNTTSCIVTQGLTSRAWETSLSAQ